MRQKTNENKSTSCVYQELNPEMDAFLAGCTPYIRFLSVRLRFRYPFFSPTPHDVNLGSRYGVRWQLRPLGTFTTD